MNTGSKVHGSREAIAHVAMAQMHGVSNRKEVFSVSQLTTAAG